MMPGAIWGAELALSDGQPVVHDRYADVRLAQAYALNDAGTAAWKDGNSATAISLLKRAIALAPHLHLPVGNLGLVLWRIGDMDGAGAMLKRAVEMAPEDTAPHGNLGVWYGFMHEYERADFHLLRARALAPDKPGPVWDRAIGRLERGDWAGAWPDHEIRLTMHEDRKFYPRSPAPLWNGEPLNGKTLYVRGEQGAGDRMMFSRYLPLIKQRWPTCRILFQPYDDLIPLLWQFRKICELLPVGAPFPDNVDHASFLLSIPQYFDARPDNIPADPGYIKARVALGQPANLPRAHLPSLKIGLVWTGNPAHQRNRERSIPLEALLGLAEDPRLTFYGMQVGPGAADIEALGCADLVNPLGHLLAAEGWVGTGLALRALDLLVSVDTAVAHLAGTLDVPTLTMLTKHADWRWGQHGTKTSWYPGMTLLRQDDHGDWDPVIDRVRQHLTQLADDHFL